MKKTMSMILIVLLVITFISPVAAQEKNILYSFTYDNGTSVDYYLDEYQNPYNYVDISSFRYTTYSSSLW